MTILVIGGSFQGKKDYVRDAFGPTDGERDGAIMTDQEYILAERVQNLHLFVKASLAKGREPTELIRFIVSHAAGKILVCDDICSGIIPMDAKEETWRETTGRLLCQLTSIADTVMRVQCGIPQTLKGELPC